MRVIPLQEKPQREVLVLLWSGLGLGMQGGRLGVEKWWVLSMSGENCLQDSPPFCHKEDSARAPEEQPTLDL